MRHWLFLSALLVATSCAHAPIANQLPDEPVSDTVLAEATVEDAPKKPKNLIVMIADGFGPAGLTMARDATGQALSLDRIVSGVVHTRSADSRITDSAAGGTAFAAGVQTNNGAISVDTAGRPVATLLEAARARGMTTGLVATSGITHATPASFGAHVPSRSQEPEIARQLLAGKIDVLLGGGRRFFVPSPEGRRDDGRDLVSEAEGAGYVVVSNREEMEVNETLPVLGLFSDGHIPYEIDRRDTSVPSLSQMAVYALKQLAGDADGFLLMIEGSRIDHAAHGNDAPAMLHEILEYDRTLQRVLEFAENDGQTLVVSAADHETGGMTLGRDGNYEWHPDVLFQVKRSSGPIVKALSSTTNIDSVLAVDAGMDSLGSDERAKLADALEKGATRAVYAAYADMVSRRARVGWTSGGHTATDIVLAAYGPRRDLFVGSFPIAEVGRRLASAMDFDLERLTRDLRTTDL